MDTIVREPESFGHYQSKLREQLFNAIWDGFSIMYDWDEEANAWQVKDEFLVIPTENKELILKGLFDASWEGIR